MTNITYDVDKAGILTIKIDTNKDFGPSSSGKTIIVASTNGNQRVPGKDDMMFGVNCYRYPQPKENGKPAATPAPVTEKPKKKGAGKHVCGFCGDSFKTKEALNSHIKNNHSEK